MLTSQNAFHERNGHPARRVLLVAHSDIAEPLTRYLQSLSYEVTAPVLQRDTAEACAELLFPSHGEMARTRRRRRWFEHDDDVATPGPPVFFTWNAVDAVIIQDLWLSETDQRMIPFGCLVAATDYYLRGNFTRRAIVLITDPEFYSQSPQLSRSPDEALRYAFDRNRQICFISLHGTQYNGKSLSTIGAAIKNDHENGNGQRYRYEAPARPPVGSAAHETDAPNQVRALALMSQSLAAYVNSRARLVLVDDSVATIRAIAAQFAYDVGNRPEGQVHLSEVTAGATASFDSFEQLRRTCERIIDEAVAANELLIVVTDILFDAVAWDGRRRTGIDLLEHLRATEEGRRVKLGIIGLTGVISPMITTSAFHRGADAVVNKSTGHDVTMHHAHLVDDLVVFKLLLTVATLCFQHEFLRAQRQVSPSGAKAACDELRRVLPAYAVSPHLQVAWEATEYLLNAQATFADTATAQAERAIRRIREQYD